MPEFYFLVQYDISALVTKKEDHPAFF